jgi:hypothetical protein
MDSRSWGMLARFEKKRRGYPVYPHFRLPIGHDQREIAVTLRRNAGHAFREITGHDGAKYAGMHAPNSIGMQIMGFCMAVGDINTEYKTQMKNKQSLFSSAPAYCGDFDQGLDHFQSMPNTPEYEFIYPAAQGLAAAAKKIKATEFRFTPEFHGVASLFGMDMRPKTRTVKCP